MYIWKSWHWNCGSIRSLQPFSISLPTYLCFVDFTGRFSHTVPGLKNLASPPLLCTFNYWVLALESFRTKSIGEILYQAMKFTLSLAHACPLANAVFMKSVLKSTWTFSVYVSLLLFCKCVESLAASFSYYFQSVSVILTWNLGCHTLKPHHFSRVWQPSLHRLWQPCAPIVCQWNFHKRPPGPNFRNKMLNFFHFLFRDRTKDKNRWMASIKSEKTLVNIPLT